MFSRLNKIGSLKDVVPQKPDPKVAVSRFFKKKEEARHGNNSGLASRGRSAL